MSRPEPATGTATIGELTVADVMHGEFTTLPHTVTVRDVIDWFAGGPSRGLALIVDGERYINALTAADVGGGLPAAEGREEVMQTAARRVPVVEDGGRLCGVLALTTDDRRFSCRDGA